MTKYTSLLRLATVCLLLGLVLTVSAPAAAQSASSSATTLETTKNLKERIEKVVVEKREQIKGVLVDLSNKKRGFVGEVQRISAETITIRTRKGTHILSIDETVELTQAGKVIKIDDVVVGSWAIIIGRDNDDTFRPEKIVISAATLRPPEKQVALGALNELGRTSLTITNRASGNEETYQVTRATTYQDSNGLTITAAAVPDETQVLVITKASATATEAVVIRVLVPTEDTTP
ncbi:MAG: hypothetical protein M3Q81_00750 [bacterium]|nr:hypothetical protein [bacterium]